MDYMEQMGMMDEEGFVDEYDQDFDEYGDYDGYEDPYQEEPETEDERLYAEEMTDAGADSGMEEKHEEDARDVTGFPEEEDVEFEFVETDA